MRAHCPSREVHAICESQTGVHREALGTGSWNLRLSRDPTVPLCLESRPALRVAGAPGASRCRRHVDPSTPQCILPTAPPSLGSGGVEAGPRVSELGAVRASSTVALQCMAPAVTSHECIANENTHSIRCDIIRRRPNDSLLRKAHRSFSLVSGMTPPGATVASCSR